MAVFVLAGLIAAHVPDGVLAARGTLWGKKRERNSNRKLGPAQSKSLPSDVKVPLSHVKVVPLLNNKGPLLPLPPHAKDQFDHAADRLFKRPGSRVNNPPVGKRARDETYARRHFASQKDPLVTRKRIEAKVALSGMIGTIKLRASGDLERDRALLSAHSVTAQELGYWIGRFRLDRDAGVWSADITQPNDAGLRDMRHARGFFSGKKPSLVADLVKTFSRSIRDAARTGSISIFVSPEGIDSKDKQRLSAYRLVAQALGLRVGEFRFNPRSHTATAPIEPF